MNRKNQFVVFSLSEGNKSATDSSNLRYFVPQSLRKDIKKGSHVLAVQEFFEKKRKTDENGIVMQDEAGRDILIDEKWDRWTVTFVGTREEVAIAQGEEKILAAVGDAIVQKEIAKTLAKLAKETIDVDALEAASA